jgi:hypothetical protein
MTLKEKLFDVIFNNAWEFKTKDVVPECEKVANNFAIEFAEWSEKYLYYPEYQIWVEEKNRDNRLISEKLLEVYKKEKGL